MAADLEESLGGVYSILSLEYQLPLARILLEQLDVDTDGLDVIIITGVEALGRNNDLEKLRQFTSLIQELGNPELIFQVMNVEEYIKAMADAVGLDGARFIKSGEQQQGEKEQAQEDQAVQEGTSAAIQAASQQ